MSKVRTTVYLSKGARIAASELIRTRRFSEFVEEAIFKHLDIDGMLSIEDVSRLIQELENELAGMQVYRRELEANKAVLDRFCDLMIKKMSQNDWSIEKTLRVMAVHREDAPMCHMSTSELTAAIKRRSLH